MSKPSSERTAYEGVANELARLIAEGTYPPGNPLPPSRELQARFNVADGTIRRAIALLEKRGLVARSQGRAPLVQGSGVTATTLREQACSNLRALIAGGTFPAGTTLPPELELKELLGVSRETVRAALRELEQSGEVVRRQDLRRQVAGAALEPDLRYQQVAELVRADIAAGRYPRGTLLPGEEPLGATYGASRPTISAALALLEESGEIERSGTGRRRVRETK